MLNSFTGFFNKEGEQLLMMDTSKSMLNEKKAQVVKREKGGILLDTYGSPDISPIRKGVNSTTIEDSKPIFEGSLNNLNPSPTEKLADKKL